MVDYDRPFGISLLAYLLFLLAIVMMTVATYVFFYEEDFWDHGFLQGLSSEVHRLSAVFLFGILIIISGIGLLKSSPWGRGLLMALCIIFGIHGLILAFSEPLRGISILIICVVVLLYMLTSDVSAVFQPIDSRKAVDAIEALEAYRKSRF